MPASFCIAVEHVGALERDRLERGARDVRRGGAAREAEDRAARVGVPVRRAEAGERRHEIDAAVVGHARGERLDLRGRADDPQAVAQPLHDGAADEHAALERVVGRAVALPRDGRQQVVARTRRRCFPVFISRKQPVP